jgi:hypothetical protein
VLSGAGAVVAGSAARIATLVSHAASGALSGAGAQLVGATFNGTPSAEWLVSITRRRRR